jgi:hypothetical protein
MFSESGGEHPVMFVGGGPRAGVTQVCHLENLAY